MNSSEIIWLVVIVGLWIVAWFFTPYNAVEDRCKASLSAASTLLMVQVSFSIAAIEVAHENYTLGAVAMLCPYGLFVLHVIWSNKRFWPFHLILLVASWGLLTAACYNFQIELYGTRLGGVMWAQLLMITTLSLGFITSKLVQKVFD